MLKIGNVVRVTNKNTCGIVSEIRAITPQLKYYSCITFDGDMFCTNFEKDLDFLNKNLVDFFLDYK